MSLFVVGTKPVSMYGPAETERSEARRTSYGGTSAMRKNRTKPAFARHAAGIVNDFSVSAAATAPTYAVSRAFVTAFPMSAGDHAATSAFAPSPASAAEIASVVSPVSRSHDATVTVRAATGQATKPASTIAKTNAPFWGVARLENDANDALPIFSSPNCS